jgi:hypothetical protein
VADNRNSYSAKLETFEASRFWKMIVFGAPIAGFCGFPLIIISNLYAGDSPGTGILIGLSLSYVLVLLAYFPGNLSLLWPCAVEVDPGNGLRLVGPFKMIYVPISDIGEIEKSLS